MKQYQLSKAKRFTKPILFGTLIVGLATAFFNRHLLFEDLEDIRAEQRALNQAKLHEVLERRHRQMVELAEKKIAGGKEH